MKTSNLKILIIAICTLALPAQSCSDDDTNDNSDLRAIELTGNLEEDEARVDDLLDDIITMVETIDCTNEDNWKITPIGYRFCGEEGPEAYLAYPIEIEASAFLKQIEVYRLSKKALIEKWDLASTCEQLQVPTGIQCEDNEPALVY
ncbi:hypothetical protein [Pareuzebyella sediminis]|uniref:hypothetical protein n=1 Tax=Pareuzebyella sediminis TaxID=2607998 RepID=UPI0011EC7812|nr:hypothetical protein [Pareuzebyella sediminis]